MAPELDGNKEFSMISRARKLPAVLLLAAGVAGCSANSACLQEVSTHPGMTCMDVGLGWYHAVFVSQVPADQHYSRVNEAPVTPASAN
jgi:hypothetical protein